MMQSMDPSKDETGGLQAVDTADTHDREDCGDDDKIPLDRLKKLAEFSELKALLLNKHLRQLLLEVERSSDKSSIVERLMQEPLFVEFADHCLSIVRPEEK